MSSVVSLMAGIDVECQLQKENSEDMDGKGSLIASMRANMGFESG